MRFALRRAAASEAVALKPVNSTWWVLPFAECSTILSTATSSFTDMSVVGSMVPVPDDNCRSRSTSTLLSGIDKNSSVNDTPKSSSACL